MPRAGQSAFTATLPAAQPWDCVTTSPRHPVTRVCLAMGHAASPRAERPGRETGTHRGQPSARALQSGPESAACHTHRPHHLIPNSPFGVISTLPCPLQHEKSSISSLFFGVKGVPDFLSDVGTCALTTVTPRGPVPTAAPPQVALQRDGPPAAAAVSAAWPGPGLFAHPDRSHLYAWIKILSSLNSRAVGPEGDTGSEALEWGLCCLQAPSVAAEDRWADG